MSCCRPSEKAQVPRRESGSVGPAGLGLTAVCGSLVPPEPTPREAPVKKGESLSTWAEAAQKQLVTLKELKYEHIA